MNCPFRDNPMPPCKISPHPDRPHIEYCKVCGEWTDLQYVGNDFPNVFWFMVGVAIVLMLFTGLLNDLDSVRLRDLQTPPRNYPGRTLG